MCNMYACNRNFIFYEKKFSDKKLINVYYLCTK